MSEGEGRNDLRAGRYEVGGDDEREWGFATRPKMDTRIIIIGSQR